MSERSGRSGVSILALVAVAAGAGGWFVWQSGMGTDGGGNPAPQVEATEPAAPNPGAQRDIVPVARPAPETVPDVTPDVASDMAPDTAPDTGSETGSTVPPEPEAQPQTEAGTDTDAQPDEALTPALLTPNEAPLVQGSETELPSDDSTASDTPKEAAEIQPQAPEVDASAAQIDSPSVASAPESAVEPTSNPALDVSQDTTQSIDPAPLAEPDTAADSTAEDTAEAAEPEVKTDTGTDAQTAVSPPSDMNTKVATDLQSDPTPDLAGDASAAQPSAPAPAPILPDAPQALDDTAQQTEGLTKDPAEVTPPNEQAPDASVVTEQHTSPPVEAQKAIDDEAPTSVPGTPQETPQKGPLETEATPLTLGADLDQGDSGDAPSLDRPKIEVPSDKDANVTTGGAQTLSTSGPGPEAEPLPEAQELLSQRPPVGRPADVVTDDA
ncbi:MAG: hypothetical protein ACPG7W_08415, partial [Paracoccaceae bacterium]